MDSIIRESSTALRFSIRLVRYQVDLSDLSG